MYRSYVLLKQLEVLNSIEDEQLYRLMDNHIAMLYMKAMSEGKLYQKDKRKYIDRFYPLKKTCFYKERQKQYYLL